MTADMPASERPLSEQFRIVAKQWVDLHAAAELKEETKTATFSQLVMREIESANEPIPFNRAEATVKGSSVWLDYLHEMVEARKHANRAKVQMEYIRMKFSEWQSLNANARQERNLSR
jgi:hypothetical protein